MNNMRYIPLETFIEFLQGSIDRVNEDESGLMVKELDLAFNCYLATIDEDVTDEVHRQCSLAIHLPDPTKSFDVNFNSAPLGHIKIKFSVLPSKEKIADMKPKQNQYNKNKERNDERISSINNINNNYTTASALYKREVIIEKIKIQPVDQQCNIDLLKILDIN